MWIILSILFGLMTLLMVNLQHTYARVTLKELKRRARSGDDLAEKMVCVAGYGYSLRVVLWFFIGLSGAAFFVSVSLQTPTWLAIILCGGLIWVGFARLPAARVTGIGVRIASGAAPILASLLQLVYPSIDWLLEFVHHHRPISVHTGLYHKDDLIDLIKRQQVQSDSRITEEELRIALQALSFGERMVGQVMTPLRMVKTVASNEDIGPILMNELHASGHSRFPVTGTKSTDIVGTLYLRDLVHKQRADKVSGVMDKNVYYVNEELSIEHALQAFLKTRHHLFVVVNRFEEVVGVLSIEDVLEQIIGRHIVDEFDQYDDLRAVAAKAAQADKHNHAATSTRISNESTENAEKITELSN